MKKIALCLAFSCLAICNAKAIDSTGCGLGSTIFKGQRGTVPQVLAVTTNATSGNQTFGITSGTLGCDPYGRITGGTGRILVFLENNFDNFALDASRGQGETINTLASITNRDVKEVEEVVKNNFNEIFTDENVNLVDVSEKLATLLNVA